MEVPGSYIVYPEFLDPFPPPIAFAPPVGAGSQEVVSSSPGALSTGQVPGEAPKLEVRMAGVAREQGSYVASHRHCSVQHLCSRVVHRWLSWPVPGPPVAWAPVTI